MLTADQLRVKALLTETIMLLCKNGLHFKSEFSIEGLIGITLDGNEIFLVNINETVHHSPENSSELDADQAAGSNEPSIVRKIPRKRRKSSRTPDRVLPPRPNTEMSSQMRSDPDPSRRSEDSTKWSNLDSQSTIKVEASRSGPCQFENHGRSLDNLDASGSKSEAPDSLQISNVQGNLREWKENAVASEHTTSGDFDPQPVVQEPTEPARKKLLINSDAGVRNQRQISASNSDDPDRSDADVIHIKEETASDEELSRSENSFAGYLGLYGVDTSYAAPAADQLPMQMSSDVLLPGCSTWSRRGGNVRPTSPQQQVELVPGTGVYISYTTHLQFEQDQALKGSKLVRRLVHELFPDERVLATSSCLGKRQGTSHTGLDQQKVDAIRTFVQQRLPHMSHSKIVLAINECCRDARTKLRRLVYRQWNAKTASMH